MPLLELASRVAGARVVVGPDFEVRRVIQDSRIAGPGDLFVARRGQRSDGHDFAAAAARRGAAVALERPVPLPPRTAWMRLPDTRPGLAGLSAALCGRPGGRLLVVGVTGTNGKSTTTHLTAGVLESAGLPAGYLSTVAHHSPGATVGNDSGQTTMEPPEVQAWLARMVAEGARAAVLEASSHALEQARLAACDIDVAAFTSVTADHLEYHGSRQAYLRAKARLIELCAAGADKGVPKCAVLNRDDPAHEALMRVPIRRRLTYGIDHPADVRATDLRASPVDTAFRLEADAITADIRLPLPGRFNVANALCAVACGVALGLSVERLAAGLDGFTGLRGRLERVDLGQPFAVYIDYAHSASGLASVLAEIRPAGGRLVAVFGASSRSGGHDPAGMGRAAARHADFFVITTDDPRDVDPGELARQVEAGVGDRSPGRDYEVVLDRRKAIQRAVALARPGDVVLLAGKGHERTLELAGGSLPWDERAEAVAALGEVAR
ncbi:MAG TPA: UDP-N-acetylmuramoyl-L-alanyl-D-glutamate--2,6-diaminopimelate ligase [Candidatus Eisenbacteria bacterium]|nr:UDP-N-acetylmuramoyl-L-alanyl-D-glutamate--2,6-diaminopimelate ligase [Candidatus Eisenbacteria bacterium]